MMQLTNQKRLCKTFADRACLRMFVNSCLELSDDKNDTEVDGHGTSKFTSNFKSDIVLLQETTLPLAIALKEFLDNNSVTQAVFDSYAYGMIVDSLTFTPIAPWQLADIQSFLN